MKTVIGRLFVLSLLLVSLTVMNGRIESAGHTNRSGTSLPVLITFKSQPGPDQVALVRSLGGEIKYKYDIIPAMAATVPEAAVSGLLQSPQVVRVEPDGVTHLLDAEMDNSWGVKRIGAETVHNAGNKGAGVRVGIIDSGIDTDHPDLRFDPDCSYNYIDPGTPPEDDHSHGTHVAGTIAAQDNGFGVVGVAPEVTLCIYKVFDGLGNADWSDIIAAVNQAVQDAVQVTNNSYGDSSAPDTLMDALKRANERYGVVHVAGAGNNSFWIINGPCIYPALWPWVIAVGATNSSDGRASFSSVCSEMELAAPGVDINSTWNNGGYGTKSGTSMATPHVAGTAALIIAAGITDADGDGLVGDEVRQRLIDTADDLGPAGHDNEFGYGLVDAAEAASGSGLPNTPPVADSQSVTTLEDSPVGITLTASDAEDDPLTYSVVTAPANGALNGTPPNLTYSPDLNFNGADSFTFVANDSLASSEQATVSITVSPVQDPPVADSQNVISAEDMPLDITLSGSDPDGEQLEFNIVTWPSNGTLSGDSPNMTYLPDSDFNGSDSFTFIANDGTSSSTEATVSITVTSVNDPPVAVDQNSTTPEDTPINLELSGSDVDGDFLTYDVITGPSNGNLSGTVPNLTYLPDPNFNGSDTFTYAVSDGKGGTDTATVTITVNAVNDPPVAFFDFACTGLTCSFDASSSDDVDNDLLDYGWNFGDGDTSIGVTVDHTYEEKAIFTVSLAVTDTGGLNHVYIQNVPVSSPDPATVHIGDLDGGSQSQGKTWIPSVGITVHDALEGPIAGAVVTGNWIGTAGETDCITDPSGSCIIYGEALPKKTGTVQFSVTAISYASHMYRSTDNHDVDGDSDGSTVVVSKDSPQPEAPTPQDGTYAHVGDLDGSTKSVGRNKWKATVIITIHDENENPVANATVDGTWTGGYYGTDACLTDSSGSCSLGTANIDALDSVTFTVTGVTHIKLTYSAVDNHERDNDSSGTEIVIARP